MKLPDAYDFSRVIVTCMKDEGPYILDWVSHHITTGFTHFVVYTNDCSDTTVAICNHLASLGILTHYDNPPPYPKGVQKTAYMRMQESVAIKDAEWIMALDVDEYLRIDVGDGTLDDVFEILPDNMTAVSFLWQIFGNNGVDEFKDRPVVKQFTRSTRATQMHPYHIRGLKTLFRRDCFEQIGTHRPLKPIAKMVANRPWFDANGIDISNIYNEKPYWMALPNGAGFGFMLGRVHHYALRSRPAFFLKMERGFVNRKTAGIRGENSPAHYWMHFNWNNKNNKNPILGFDVTKSYRAHFRDDERLERLHKKSVRHHRKAYAQIESDNEWLNVEIARIKAMGNGQSFSGFDVETLEHPITNWYLDPAVGSKLLEHSVLDRGFVIRQLKAVKWI